MIFLNKTNGDLFMEFIKELFTNKNDDRSLYLGKIKNRLFAKEKLTEAELNHHVHIVGASGYGKTVLISQMIEQQIAQGKGLMFIDLKGDIETLDKLTSFVQNNNRQNDLLIFSLTDQNISANYNLISNGTATQLRDKIMLSFDWSEEFYKNQAGSYLLKLLLGLVYLRDYQNIKFDLGTILKASESTEYLQDLMALIPAIEKDSLFAMQSCLGFLNDKSNYQSLQGLRSQLESLVYADFGKMIRHSETGISLFEAINQNKIIFIFLDSRRYGETARSVGKFILQDLKMVSGRIDAEIKKHYRKPFSVIIDEFADLAQEDFIGFLDRARSSKMSVVVAHQEICDLQRISPEFAGRLMGNTSTLYAFLQKRPESAEMISGMAGTRTVWKQTIQTERFGFFQIESGNGSKREVEEFVIHPNAIKGLRVGKCVCIKKYPHARAYEVSVTY
jgi:type IV secretory pathway TraG/TraD family ATPase VirD4